MPYKTWLLCLPADCSRSRESKSHIYFVWDSSLGTSWIHVLKSFKPSMYVCKYVCLSVRR